ncbi:hypothetical protein THAOC_03817 [Thalassiosira oceanica]|uniref:aspartate--tRNA ligase n=1 Tax=Thalassiosira oceanica TaxID=159749 RepID=K0TKC7_THAOC|nr:hypothetical protein THAOC_03817 [Thalassiosira oceanica]|mmetsp:Transcript_35214/g.79381  ORF Transcript_35214/g.79381 Transcript_35214/m.79381 type:complete len:632 (+) Transcript_35214:110-2005(+)|eukprot:EJK74501.1 hypothetical protein THAOC_03817 [Thalassiosira oceanica]
MSEENGEGTTTPNPEIVELTNQISGLGAQIADAKKAKQPKEEWDPLLQQMLALKLTYKEKTGEDYHAAKPKAESKKPKGPVNQVASEKNAEKRKKKAEEKRLKEEKKRKQREERERREREKLEKLKAAADEDWSAVFGDMPMIQSASKSPEGIDKWTKIGDLGKGLAGKKVTVRGFLHTSRGVGKGAFVVLRSSLYTVQCVAFEAKASGDRGEIPQSMIKYMTGQPVESVVDVEGVVTVPEKPVEGASQSDVEIQVSKFHCVHKSVAAMPFQMEDACRPDTTRETDVGAYDPEANSTTELGRVGQENRLDNRWIDLRTPANQSIFRVQSMVCTLFREYLLSKDFIEIHTPKLLSGASEGGADVFTLDYFGRPACLSMSPQLHKQMASACGGFERVFEIGPVFRAENSNTRRHLCEFTGMDLEMAIVEHYDEVLDVIGELFVHIFDGLKQRSSAEIERVREQHPFEDLQYLPKTLKIDYATGCKMLREAGVDQGDYEDLSTENEKKLGDLVKEKYNTDFYIMDKYPLSVRPFYTMPDPNNPKLSNSYDIFIRGQEILSGAQRVHEPEFIEKRAKEWGLDVSTITSYIDSFRNGALPHGGGGIGLERVVMLYLGLPNIRKTSMFPRDPKRISP